MFDKLVLLLLSYFLALSSKFGLSLVSFISVAMAIRIEQGPESTVAELVRLAEEKGGRVMADVATNLISIVMVCAVTLQGIWLVYQVLWRLVDQYIPWSLFPVKEQQTESWYS